jgi:hypothetical protein
MVFMTACGAGYISNRCQAVADDDFIHTYHDAALGGVYRACYLINFPPQEII